MKRFIALLRGINISGKNKIPMAELKVYFEELGFVEVKTYLNSGNIIFSENDCNTRIVSDRIKTMIKDKFDLDISVLVIPHEELENILYHAPEWWGSGNKEIYDNLIFLIPPTTFTEIFNEIGEPEEKFEKIESYKSVIFWSFSRENYRKTNWWARTAKANVSEKLTIRTANTVKKIAEV